MAACSRLTPPVAALCRVEIAKSGCPIIVGPPEDILRWAQTAAGLTEAEIRPHPEHGHLIGVSGVRKLAARAPDPAAKLEFMSWLQDEFPAI